MSFDKYIKYAEETRNKYIKLGSIEEEENVESMYFISTLPWINYTSLIQPVAGGEESNPRFTWGMYKEDYNKKLQLPVSILVHHGLVDGIHIAKFYDNLENKIKNLIREYNI